MTSMTVLCRGARGSVAVSGAQFQRYGGGTTCFEICLSEDHRLLIDLDQSRCGYPLTAFRSARSAWPRCRYWCVVRMVNVE